MATEERRKEAADGEDIIYKTKIVEFLGRSTPIILQNDNGPCPLLAICNALLLRNSLGLGPDATEVPLQKLLSLVAEKLIDSNSNVQDRDDAYVSNQQQNIADAIDLLPRLATGIDVNVQFRKINDFEFTRECAIFDLLDIGLYHGWIVDPQDTDTAVAIGSKSYNTLVGELVAFETRKSEGEDKNVLEEDSVDFAAATTAALGVPSPNLSRGRSFDDCPVSVPAERLLGKGDREEVAELVRALDLSRAEVSTPLNDSMPSDVDCGSSSFSSEAITDSRSSVSVVHTDLFVAQIRDEPEKSHPSYVSEPEKSHPSYVSEPEAHDASSDRKDDGLYSKTSFIENDSISPDAGDIIQPASEGSESLLISTDSMENVRTDMIMRNQVTLCQSVDGDDSKECNIYKDQMIPAGKDQSGIQPFSEDFSTSQIHTKPIDNLIDCHSAIFCGPAAPPANIDSTNVRKELPNISEVVTSSLEGSEPIYEGEECILDSGIPVYEDREPVYEGEMVLAEQADKLEEDACSLNSKHDVKNQWQLIKNFLENNASQLTIYGLFCLQEGLKERELCVFFRNNHFGTMFKFNGELYLLATDQGYISQPDLVWEKLNEVNGDTVFMTGNFMEFKAENQVNDSWNEQSAMTSTADYLATLEGSAPSNSTLNSDLQLAIALQQQEFEQPPQRHQQQSQQQSPVSGRSRLITGPQAPRNTNAPQKSESKTKDRCVVM